MDTKKFWEERLSEGIGLQQTGHRAFNLEYNQLLYKVQSDCLDELIRNNQINTQDSSYLDVGCGGGYFIEYFKQKGANPITGIDITKQSVEYLQKKYPTAYFYESDISSPNLPVKGPFHIITAISVMYHIVDEEKFQSALNNMCALLEPGGYLILYDVFEKHWHPSPEHVRLRNITEYKPILDSWKMDIQEIIPAYYFLNRSYLPLIGPTIINVMRLGPLFYKIDEWMRRAGKGNQDGTKFLLARKNFEGE